MICSPRAAAGVPAHLFCAGLWGYALGADARSGAAAAGATDGGATVAPPIRCESSGRLVTGRQNTASRINPPVAA